MASSFHGAVAGLARRVVDQGVGEEGGVFGQVEAVGVQAGERVERSRGLAGDPKGIEHIDRAEPVAGPRGDAGGLTLGVDAEHRERSAVRRLGMMGADALARTGGGDGQQGAPGRRSAADLAAAPMAADDQPGRPAEGGFDLGAGGEAAEPWTSLDPSGPSAQDGQGDEDAEAPGEETQRREGDRSPNAAPPARGSGPGSRSHSRRPRI